MKRIELNMVKKLQNEEFINFKWKKIKLEYGKKKIIEQNEKNLLNFKWTDLELFTILNKCKLSKDDLHKLEQLDKMDHNFNIKDPLFKARLILSSSLNKIIKYKHLPYIFDFTNLRSFRYHAVFYGYYHDKRVRTFNLLLTTGLKKNIGIFYPFFFSPYAIHRLYNKINNKSWHYLNYLIRNSYITRNFDVNNLNLYINKETPYCFQLSDASCNILTLANIGHRVINNPIVDLDYSVSSEYADWLYGNHFLYLINDLFISYSLFINCYETTIIESPQLYLKYKYWEKIFKNIKLINITKYFFITTDKVKLYFKLLQLLKYNLFNIFILNLNKFIFYDWQFLNLFKVIYFKIFLRWLCKCKFKINYILIYMLKNKNHLDSKWFLFFMNFIRNKNLKNLSFKFLYKNILHYKKSEDLSYYVFKKLFHNSIFTYKTLLYKVIANFNYMVNCNWNIKSIVRKISIILKSKRENIEKKTLNYWFFFWKELKRRKYNHIYRIEKIKLPWSNLKLWSNKYNKINNYYNNYNNLFNVFITSILPNMSFYYISSNYKYKVKFRYTGRFFDESKNSLFFLMKYSEYNLDFCLNFVKKFFYLFLIIIKNNIIFNFNLYKISILDNNINIYNLLLVYFQVYYTYLRLKSNKIFNMNDNLFLGYFLKNKKFINISNVFKYNLIKKNFKKVI